MNSKLQRTSTLIAEAVVILLILVVVNWLLNHFFTRLDLTASKRYTISKSTKQLLANLDDPVTVELFLLNRNVPYDASEVRHYCGDEARAVPVLRVDWDDVPVNLAVYAAKDERAALKASPAGRPIERASLAAVSALMNADE